MKAQSKYRVIGLMSGTSLDGLDLALVELSLKQSLWNFKILTAKTKKYSNTWCNRLSAAHELPAAQLLALDVEYGKYLGDCCNKFMKLHDIKRVDLIASHGHTIFHQPNQGITFQLGNGNALFATTKTPVVCDFRSLDITQGGEGAPLVPVGDRLLFHQYEVCLNLGGIANLSFEEKKIRRAFDVCFVNMGLNFLAQKAGKPYDKNGELAKQGKVNGQLLASLDKVYASLSSKRPSLARERFETTIQPLLDDEEIALPDRLRTFSESIANEIQSAVPQNAPLLNMLVTGGGALNKFLISRIQEKSGLNVKVIIPERQIIEFKEALVFALLGVLRMRGEVNCLKSVTGARCDSVSGVLVGV